MKRLSRYNSTIYFKIAKKIFEELQNYNFFLLRSFCPHVTNDRFFVFGEMVLHNH